MMQIVLRQITKKASRTLNAFINLSPFFFFYFNSPWTWQKQNSFYKSSSSKNKNTNKKRKTNKNSCLKSLYNKQNKNNTVQNWTRNRQTFLIWNKTHTNCVLLSFGFIKRYWKRLALFPLFRAGRLIFPSLWGTQ